MFKYKIFGLFSGLFFSIHSIGTIVHINLHYFILLILLFVSIFVLAKKDILNNLYIYKSNVIVFSFLLGLILYVLLTYILNPESIMDLIEFILILLFFFLGKKMNIVSLKYFYFTIIIVTLVQSSLLIFDRGYIYDYGINYLLITLMISPAMMFVYMLLFEKNISLYKKILLTFITLIYIFALLNTQSRTSFLSAILFILIYPVYILESRKKKYYIFFLVLIISFGANFMYNIYENSVIVERMSNLFLHPENESRIGLYELYFHQMNGMWITGFGIGQGNKIIFANSIDKYPHNFILEFSSEFGMIGIFFIISFLLATFFKLYNLKFKSINIFFKFNTILFLYLLLIFSKSFSIYDSYVLFFSFGLIWSLDTSFKRKKNLDKYNYTNTQS